MYCTYISTVLLVGKVTRLERRKTVFCVTLARQVRTPLVMPREERDFVFERTTHCTNASKILLSTNKVVEMIIQVYSPNNFISI